MKTRRLLSMLLAVALVVGLLPAVMPTVVEAAAPADMHNYLPTTAKDIVYLSDMFWENSINYQSGVTIKDKRWNDGNKIVLGRNKSTDTAFNNTTFTKGLGVMPKGTSTTDVSYTVFDLADNGYKQSYFYSAAGLTNSSALSTNKAYGVVFQVWGSYDKSGTTYDKAEYTLLESSGNPDYGTHVNQDYVYQFHVDITGVRYLKLVVYAVGAINGMNSAWGGACVYNNEGYAPKSELMGLNNATNNNTWVPTGTTRFHTYNFNNLPSDAVYLSGSEYKDSSGNKTDKVVSSTVTGFGTDGRWLGGVTNEFVAYNANSVTEQREGILATKAEYLRFNAPSATATGQITFDISGLNATRFYAALGSGNQATVHKKYHADGNNFGGITGQIWGAKTQDGEYTLLAESEAIMLSNVGEFDVDITGYNYLRLSVKTKNNCSNSGMDVLFYKPCVYQKRSVSVSGENAVVRGTTANYSAAVTGGEGYGDVTWAVAGAAKTGTKIDANGKLTIASDETAACLEITASVTENEVTTTSERFSVVVLRTPKDVRNHLPSTATNVKYLSDMAWEYTVNNTGDTTKDYAWNNKNVPIVLGDILDNGGTRFEKGLGVMPMAVNAGTTSYTVYDLADNGYAQSFFYAATGISNDTAKSSTSTTDVKNGVVFSVYGSFDKTVANYEDAEFVLLEKSDTLNKGTVYQFHVDVTGVRYLKLEVTAVTSHGYMNSAWGGACVYNNPGYYPKTDMLSSRSKATNSFEDGAYVAFANRDTTFKDQTPTMFNAFESMFNTYQFPNLPADAVNVATMTRKETVIYNNGTPSVGAGWIGGTHREIADVTGAMQSESWQKDGLKFPANSSMNFNVRTNAASGGATDSYVVYDISALDVDTFYSIVGVTNGNSKYLEYTPSNGQYGGLVFEVWGTYAGSSEYQLLSSSGASMKSNTGEFIVDVTGVQLLKLRIRAQDPRTHASATGGFAYPRLFKDAMGVTVVGDAYALKGATAEYTVKATRAFTKFYNYTGDIAWTVTGANGAGTKMENGKLIVDSAETATSLQIAASIQEGNRTLSTEEPMTVIVAAGDKVAYVENGGFDTLEDAIAAADEKPVTMLKDIALTEAVAIDKAVILDLNGKTLSGADKLTLGAGTDLTIKGGKLEGKLALAASGAKLTADCDISLELNGNDATVNAKKVTLVDTATKNGTVGGKVYGDFELAETVTKEENISYVAVPGTDAKGDYYTSNAVRVKVKRISIRPSAAGLYYTTEIIFNKNVAKVGATYGVALSLANKPGSDFATDTDTLWTKFVAPGNKNFNSTGTSCLISNILKEGDAENAARGAMDIHANAYVKLTVNGEDVVVMMENVSDVKYSLKTVMQGLDSKLGEGKLDTDTTQKAAAFYGAWEKTMLGWNLPNLAAKYETIRVYLEEYQVILTDIANGRIVVTDLNAADPLAEKNLIWQWSPTTAQGWGNITTASLAGALSEAKVRWSAQYNTNVVLFCSSRGYAGMIEYPSGKCLWKTEVGQSPHSIELLPNGDIVVASSGGGTWENGRLYYYDLKDGAYTYNGEYELNGAHGLSWDPDNQLLWALGFPKLVAYTLGTDSDGKGTLKLAEGKGCNVPNGTGHDLVVDYRNSDILWLTDSKGVYQFSKSQNKLLTEYPHSATLKSVPAVKGMGIFSDSVLFCVSYTGIADGNHPSVVRMYRPERDGTITLKQYENTAFGFNKVRVFCADYL